eukprot:CAMPEP_0174944678 /NCGR_PEP_ID=MMETSP1355-20121228/79721_1 /TAXON_ID=464990 /ORGANISM="Hemiselmis tepida, Strain CCMP443" /LENGTH=242 /DNA_ID=CAMNT_0016191999 /DNA_START=135 /DNA_END=860 /DNA_ORIENTATION=+
MQASDGCAKAVAAGIGCLWSPRNQRGCPQPCRGDRGGARTPWRTLELAWATALLMVALECPTAVSASSPAFVSCLMPRGRMRSGKFGGAGNVGSRRAHQVDGGEIRRCFVLRNETVAVAVVEEEPPEGAGPADDERFAWTRCRSFRLASAGGGERVTVGEATYEDCGLGSKVWESSICLAAWLSLHPDTVRGRRVLELGAGTGVGGLLAAQLGPLAVRLSDFPGGGHLLLPNLERNIAAASP